MDRDIVLALDCSMWMSGSPTEYACGGGIGGEGGLTLGNSFGGTPEDMWGSRFHIAQSIVVRFLQQEMINATSHTRVLPVLFGSRPSSDQLTKKEEHEGKYACAAIYELSGLVPPTVALTREILELQPSEDTETDCFDVILAGLSLVNKYGSTTRKRDREITVITDGGAKHFSNVRSTLGAIVEQLASARCRLSVIWIESPVPTDAQTGTEALLRELCSKEPHRFMGTAEAFCSISNFIKKRVRLTTKTRLPLVFSDRFEIPVWCYLKTKEETLPAPCSESALAPPESKGSILNERIYVEAFPATKEGADGTKDGSTHEDTLLDNACESRTRAVFYGRSIIPLTEAELSLLKYNGGPKSLTILGTVPQLSVPLQDFVEKTECVCADPHSDVAQAALADLVAGLKDTNSALVARYVWREPYPPKIVLLTPSESDPWLFLNVLPFREDFQDTKALPGLPPVTEEECEAVDTFVNAMMLHPPLDETNNLPPKGTVLLEPEHVVNPTLHKLYRVWATKSLQHSFSLPFDTSTLDAVMDVPEQCRDAVLASIETVEAIGRLFPLIQSSPPRAVREQAQEDQHNGADNEEPDK